MSAPIAGRSRAAAVVVLLLAAVPAGAQTNYFWNAPSGGNGTWDLSAQSWATASGGPVDYTWTNSGSEVANFGNTAGTVTLGAGITASGIIFSTTGYTITGDTLTLAGTGGVIDTGTVNATINSILAGSVGLTKNGTGKLTLGGADTYTGKTTIAAGTLALGASNVLPATTTLQIGTFTGSGGAAVSGTTTGNFNLGSSSQTVGSLYTFSASSTANTITIASGQNLTVSSASGTGTLTAFGAYNGTGGAVTHVTTLTGGGSFTVNTPSAAFQVGQAALPSGFPGIATQGSLTTVNMQALSSFSATVSAFRVGDFTGGGNAGSATLSLAPDSTIIAADFIAASGRLTNSTTAGHITVNLGAGTSVIQANNIYIGGNPPSGISNPRSEATLKFLNSNGSLTLRAQNGTDGANLFVGVQTNGSGTFARNNFVNLDFHNVDVKLNTVQLGGFNGGTTTANDTPINGVFSFTQGTVTASSILIGFRSGTSNKNNTGAPQGTFNVNGSAALTVTGSGADAISLGSNTQSNSFTTSSGTYVTLGTLAIAGGSISVPNGGITLATNTGTFAGGSGTFNTTGILNVYGGTLTVGGDIVKGAATSPGTATATLTLNAAVTAVLDLNGHRIGGTTAASAIDTLNLQVGTLQNVLEINNGAGLTKNTTGTLTLAGTNSYTGTTAVSAGTLAVATGGTIGAGSLVSVTNTGTLAGTGTVNGAVTVSSGGAVRGDVTGGTGALTVANDVTLADNGVIRAELGRTAANSASASLLKVTGSGVLNLAPTAGNKFAIDIVSNTSNPLVAGEAYTITLATVASGTINVNGAAASGTIDPSTYILWSSMTSAQNVSLTASGGNLVLTFTPVPEPAITFALAAGALGAAGLVRWLRRA